MLFDSHCHLHFPQFDNDREEIIKKLRDSDVKAINVGTDFETSEKAGELAQRYPGLLWASAGLHPSDVNQNFDVSEYKKLASNKNVVAIGECGLDYFRIAEDELEIKEKQKEIFINQIELAKELNKPLIFHCRPAAKTQDAYSEAIEILKFQNLNIVNGNGVAHFFSGSKEIARQFLKLGFFISFAGPVTFASEYRELVEFAPIDRILIETDAPFASPLPYRGRRNEPVYVKFVAQKIAEWKRLEFEQIAEQTVKNAARLFNLNF